MNKTVSNSVRHFHMDARVLALLSAGLFLRLLQLLSDRSLWLDEAYLSISIVTRPLAKLLTTPLEYNQVAPPLYLVVAKASTLLFGPSEFALRLPAFLCSAGSLFLFAPTARSIVREPGFLIALAMFAFAPTLVEYAGEAKPYSGDALGAVAVMLCTIQVLTSDFSTKTVIRAAAIGVLAVLLSYGSIFVVIGASITLLGFAVRHPKSPPFLKAAALSLAWALGIALTAWWASRSTAQGTTRVMEDYWQFAFMPFPPNSRYEALWVWRAISDAYSSGFGVRFLSWIFVVAAATGAATLWRQHRRATLTLLISPLVIVIACSAARAYPFYDRLTLFVLPVLALLAAAGFATALSKVTSKAWPVLGVVFAIIIFPARSVLLGHAPASRTEALKPVLAHVSTHWRRGDAMYVFYGATPAMRYYAPRFRFSERDWTGGTANRGNINAYLRELDAFRGRDRVWVIFSHDVVPGEREAVLGYLNTIGEQLKGQNFPRLNSLPPASAVFLYNLSDSSRLSHASADSFTPNFKADQH
jgi:hypothetical protein